MFRDGHRTADWRELHRIMIELAWALIKLAVNWLVRFWQGHCEPDMSRRHKIPLINPTSAEFINVPLDPVSGIRTGNGAFDMDAFP
jgi:hypothetical protein